MNVAKTDRLILRKPTLEDAEFILGLVNEPSWLQFIGDRGVRNIDDARAYMLKGPIAMYGRLGFGLYLVALRDGAVPIGMCGLIKRDTLTDVDLGFAFLPAFWGKGYAAESARAALELGWNRFGLKRIVAITSPANSRSIKVLENIGFVFEKKFRLTEADEVKLFAIEI